VTRPVRMSVPDLDCAWSAAGARQKQSKER
jgi:hypothetical protein